MKWANLLITVLGSILILEIVLRLFGFHTPPLYISSDTFQYIYAPNQNVRRFGNRIITNSQSQRSDEPKTNATKILKVGDSIINGGSLTDHEDLASSILTKELTKYLKKDVQVLNVSASSWGPDNVYEYLLEYGHFNSKIIVMVFSSHDLHDIKDDGSPVDVSIYYPGKNPPFAIYELIERYILKRKIATDYQPKKKYQELQIERKVKENPGFINLVHYGKKNKLEMVAYLHPTLSELRNKEYFEDGKRVINIWRSEDILILKGMDYLNEDCYRDELHLNVLGQKTMANALFPILRDLMNEE